MPLFEFADSQPRELCLCESEHRRSLHTSICNCRTASINNHMSILYKPALRQTINANHLSVSQPLIRFFSLSNYDDPGCIFEYCSSTWLIWMVTKPTTDYRFNLHLTLQSDEVRNDRFAPISEHTNYVDPFQVSLFLFSIRSTIWRYSLTNRLMGWCWVKTSRVRQEGLL